MANKIRNEMLNLGLKVPKNAAKRVNNVAISKELNTRLFFVEKTTRPAKKNRALKSIRIVDIVTLIK